MRCREVRDVAACRKERMPYTSHSCRRSDRHFGNVSLRRTSVNRRGCLPYEGKPLRAGTYFPLPRPRVTWRPNAAAWFIANRCHRHIQESVSAFPQDAGNGEKRLAGIRQEPTRRTDLCRLWPAFQTFVPRRQTGGVELRLRDAAQRRGPTSRAATERRRSMPGVRRRASPDLKADSSGRPTNRIIPPARRECVASSRRC
jgi:hypothetical protein